LLTNPENLPSSFGDFTPGARAMFQLIDYRLALPMHFNQVKEGH
jgi:hypothetical protein